jgi:glutamyl-tRNA reductase
MTLLCLGLSHRSAPVPVLERYSLDREAADKLATTLVSSGVVSEALVLTTCNRVEVYAEADRFHAAVTEVSAALAQACGAPLEEFSDYVGVSFSEAALTHLFELACGLDSMAVGESQILGQVRQALRAGQDGQTVGTTLNACFQHALRVGKRAHAETELDSVAASLVQLALDLAHPEPLPGRRVLVIGAGAMSALVTATLVRKGAAVTVANRTRARAERLAHLHGATAAPLAAVPGLVRDADLVITATGAPGQVLTAETVAPRIAERELAVIDLALPRDVTREVAALPGMRVVDLEALAGAGGAVSEQVLGPVRDIVEDEVATFHEDRSAAGTGPTVAALRRMADRVVHTELDRLEARTPGLTAGDRDEIALAVHRIVGKLLHTPTVRVKQLARQQPTSSYTAALRELFALDQETIDQMTGETVPRPVADLLGRGPGLTGGAG